MFEIANTLIYYTRLANNKYINDKSNVEYSWAYDFKSRKTTIKIIEWLYFNGIFDYKAIEKEKHFSKIENAIKFLEKQVNK